MHSPDEIRHTGDHLADHYIGAGGAGEYVVQAPFHSRSRARVDELRRRALQQAEDRQAEI